MGRCGRSSSFPRANPPRVIVSFQVVPLIIEGVAGARLMPCGRSVREEWGHRSGARRGDFGPRAAQDSWADCSRCLASCSMQVLHRRPRATKVCNPGACFLKPRLDHWRSLPDDRIRGLSHGLAQVPDRANLWRRGRLSSPAGGYGPPVGLDREPHPGGRRIPAPQQDASSCAPSLSKDEVQFLMGAKRGDRF